MKILSVLYLLVFPLQAVEEQAGLEMNEVNQEPDLLALKFLYNTDEPKDTKVSLLQICLNAVYCIFSLPRGSQSFLSAKPLRSKRFT